MRALTRTLSELKPPQVTAEDEARVREFEAAQEREMWRRRLAEAGIPRAHRRAVAPESLPREVAAYIAAFGDGTRRGLLLTGPYGTGKTQAACAVLVHAAKSFPVAFATMPEVVEQAATFERDALSRYRNTRLLCLDDLGKERPTEFAMEQVYSLVDYRWREGKPTVVTTNHGADGLLAHFRKVADRETAEAIVSRLMGMCDVVRMGGADRRLA